jgi:sugar/nucleoside kinase (ribokinase family)
MFLLNDEEAIQLTNKTNIYDAANHLLKNGPSVVVIKQGGNGALLAYEDVRIQVPVFPIDKLIDPTGAGDSFAGGFIGHLVNHKQDDLIEAVITGSAVASFTVSGFGVEGLLGANITSIESRKDVIRTLMEKIKTT